MTNEEREDMNTFKHDLVKQARWWQWKAETLEKENEQLKAENAALCERLDKAIELPCKVGDTLYELVTDNTIQEWIIHSIFVSSLGFDVNCAHKDYTEHKRFYIRKYQNDLTNNKKVFISREAALASLAEE